ncbi:MAG TPA: ABC transporter ATP-binding protein [Armatimonadetes bacterium]|nr:ABC transporter ATP-binding protein [Armatimonadota bacterium]
MSEEVPMLQLQDICLRKGNFSLEHISFAVQPGECFVLLGPTGTGKTTVLETIAGLNRPLHGEVWIDGRAVTHLKPEQRQISYVPQDYALFPHLRVMDNLTLACRLRRMPRLEIEGRLRELVELLHLEPLLSRWPHHLSGGEKQRVALARALMIRPQVLLLDEPLSALDAAARRSVRGELKRVLNLAQATTIIVTHDYVDAFTFGDHIGVMDKGRLVQVGTREELLFAPKSKFIAEFTGVNFFTGYIDQASEDGLKIARVGEVCLYCLSELEGEVFLSFFPSDVTLSRTPPQGSARNVLKGVVRDLVHLGDRVRVGLDCGLPLVAEVTAQAVEELHLREGDEVFASFKAISVKTYR